MLLSFRVVNWEISCGIFSAISGTFPEKFIHSFLTT